jgi:hypothetical protein
MIYGAGIKVICSAALLSILTPYADLKAQDAKQLVWEGNVSLNQD